MRKNILIHIPHSSLYIPEDYQNNSLLPSSELDEENLFMCDYRVNELLDNKSQTIIFPYSRLYCDVERFKSEDEIMNKYGMGYIYTKTSEGKNMFDYPSNEHKKIIDKIYDEHHNQLDNITTNILQKYEECIIIDLHSYSDEQVFRLFKYQNVPDICIGIEEKFYSKELTDYFLNYFQSNGYTTMINYPYSGSIIPNKYYRCDNVKIISIMIEINKRVYMNDFDHFKKVLKKGLNF